MGFTERPPAKPLIAAVEGYGWPGAWSWRWPPT